MTEVVVHSSHQRCHYLLSWSEWRPCEPHFAFAVAFALYWSLWDFRWRLVSWYLSTEVRHRVAWRDLLSRLIHGWWSRLFGISRCVTEHEDRRLDGFHESFSRSVTVA